MGFGGECLHGRNVSVDLPMARGRPMVSRGRAEATVAGRAVLDEVLRETGCDGPAVKGAANPRHGRRPRPSIPDGQELREKIYCE